MPDRMLNIMTKETMNAEQTAAVFADPVGYLADLGIDAVLISATNLAAAA